MNSGIRKNATENFNKNLGLIRRRIKSENLWLKDIFIGKESKTKVSIVYMNNIVEDKLIKKVEFRPTGTTESAFLQYPQCICYPFKIKRYIIESMKTRLNIVDTSCTQTTI